MALKDPPAGAPESAYREGREHMSGRPSRDELFPGYFVPVFGSGGVTACLLSYIDVVGLAKGPLPVIKGAMNPGGLRGLPTLLAVAAMTDRGTMSAVGRVTGKPLKDPL